MIDGLVNECPDILVFLFIQVHKFSCKRDYLAFDNAYAAFVYIWAKGFPKSLSDDVTKILPLTGCDILRFFYLNGVYITYLL